MARARGTDGSLLASLPWTLLALAFALLPHVPYLPVWITAALLACAIWRYSIEVRRKPVPPALLRAALALACFMGVLYTYNTISGVGPGSALLAIMAALKLLETRQRRDQFVLLFIAIFLVMSSLLREQYLWSLPYLVLGVILIMTAWLRTAADDAEPVTAQPGHQQPPGPVCRAAGACDVGVLSANRHPVLGRADRHRHRGHGAEQHDQPRRYQRAVEIRRRCLPRQFRRRGSGTAGPLLAWSRAAPFRRAHLVRHIRAQDLEHRPQEHRAAGRARALPGDDGTHAATLGVCARHSLPVGPGEHVPGPAAPAHPRAADRPAHRLRGCLPPGLPHRCRAVFVPARRVPRISRGPQPAHRNTRAQHARGSPLRRGIRTGGADEVQRGGIPLHARTTATRQQSRRSLPVRDAPRLLRALCLGVCAHDARRGDTGAHRRWVTRAANSTPWATT